MTGSITLGLGISCIIFSIEEIGLFDSQIAKIFEEAIKETTNFIKIKPLATSLLIIVGFLVFCAMTKVIKDKILKILRVITIFLIVAKMCTLVSLYLTPLWHIAAICIESFLGGTWVYLTLRSELLYDDFDLVADVTLILTALFQYFIGKKEMSKITIVILKLVSLITLGTALKLLLSSENDHNANDDRSTTSQNEDRSTTSQNEDRSTTSPNEDRSTTSPNEDRNIWGIEESEANEINTENQRKNIKILCIFSFLALLMTICSKIVADPLKLKRIVNIDIDIYRVGETVTIVVTILDIIYFHYARRRGLTRVKWFDVVIALVGTVTLWFSVLILIYQIEIKLNKELIVTLLMPIFKIGIIYTTRYINFYINANNVLWGYKTIYLEALLSGSFIVNF